MHLPRAVARFNRRVTNPVQRMWADKLPAYGIVVHTGRRSGRVYRTPVNVFQADGGFAVLLLYGTDVDWVRNLQHAGSGELVHRRRSYRISAARVVSGAPGRALLPMPVRLLSRLVRNDDVLQLCAVPA